MTLEIENLRLNSQKIIDSYIDKSDWRSRENANQQFSFSGLLLHSAGTIMSHYALRNVYPLSIAKAHYEGVIHLHDLYSPIIGYCCGHSLRQILAEGLKRMGHIESKPAKHLRTALNHLVNYLGVMQHEWAGAQAISSLDTYLAPFIAKDNLSDVDIYQSLQEFIYHLNTTSRWGMQLNFTNISLDFQSPTDLKDEYSIVGGEIQTDKYSDFTDEQERFNKQLIEIYYQGDSNQRVFTFPIPTINITKDFPWKSDIAYDLFKLTAKYGIPYFQNFINSDLNPSDVRSMCCRLQLRMDELRNKTGGYFGYGESTGSIGVVTCNMNRIGYLANDDDEYFELLDDAMGLAKKALEIKRQVIKTSLKSGLLPATKYYIQHFNHHFSTIGLVGMNESLLNFMDKTIGDEEGRKFAVRVLKHMRGRLVEFQEETENLYSLEATPAEGTSYRLAKSDKKMHPDIRFYNTERNKRAVPYLTNSTQLPVDYTEDPFEALQLQEELQGLYNSGTVFHLFVGEETPAPSEVVSRIIRKVATDYRIPCYTYTPTFSVCPSHGYLSGKIERCPDCNSKCEVYSRIVGYLRPTSSWNKGKSEEFRERKTFKVK